MRNYELLQSILRTDLERSHHLTIVASLGLPDCWIGAGFVRDAVWEHLHEKPSSAPSGDIDVVWFDPVRAYRHVDRRYESALRDVEPAALWSVKNQARMHRRNGDPQYTSVSDAMRYWPDTATAVAARMTPSGAVEIAAPYGLADLFSLVVRPTPRFSGEKRDIFEARVREKGWLAKWPRLTMAN